MDENRIFLDLMVDVTKPLLNVGAVGKEKCIILANEHNFEELPPRSYLFKLQKTNYYQYKY